MAALHPRLGHGTTPNSHIPARGCVCVGGGSQWKIRGFQFPHLHNPHTPWRGHWEKILIIIGVLQRRQFFWLEQWGNIVGSLCFVTQHRFKTMVKEISKSENFILLFLPPYKIWKLNAFLLPSVVTALFRWKLDTFILISPVEATCSHPFIA